MSYSKGYVVKNNSEDIQLNTLSQVDYERLTSVVASNIKKINLKGIYYTLLILKFLLFVIVALNIF